MNKSVYESAYAPDQVQAARRFRSRTLHSAAAGAAATAFRGAARVWEVAFVLSADLVALLAAFILATCTRSLVLPWVFPALSPQLPAELAQSLWWAPALAAVLFAWEGLYSSRLPFWWELKRLYKAASAAFVIILAMITLAKMGHQVSRTVLVITYVYAIVLLPASRLATKKTLGRLGLWRRRVLVLGAGRTGELVVRALGSDPYRGLEVAGLLDDDPAKKGKSFPLPGGRAACVLGGFGDCEKLMGSLDVQHVIVAAPGMRATDLVRLVNRLQRKAESVTVIPDLYGVPVKSAEVEHYFDEQLLGFKLKNNLAVPSNILLKRAFDLAAGTFILLLAAPLMAAVAVAIKLDSPGPVIFSHRRIGRGGREFNCYKFRTMVKDADAVLKEHLAQNPALKEEWERDFKLKNDPRVTRVGGFLRLTSLDELPQILNVLKGEMSLVGPRPIVKKEVLRFGSYIEDYYLVRPGITGLWQVSGRSDIDYPERVRLESWYVRNWSMWLDITILIRTVGVVLAKGGAY